ncbi:Carboxylic ester hydrolase [Colletotrichum scovillei]|nr:Carboxylic ester hydrolase [Colletotrichum scovillei]
MGNTISYQDTPVELKLGDRGTIRGLQFDDKSRRFTGVPYALPPTGEHRWRKPRPLPASYSYTDENGGAYDATKFKSVCPQKAFHVVKPDGGGNAYGEDCLFVNIWTPVPKEGEENKKWPVQLWIHGGWFQMGDPSQEPGMDATELITTGGLNAIVVAIGYRLNVFGFLAGNDLLQESNGEAGGNFGLWDQRLAAEWVRDNIAHFGGDPENVTLAGRSAGAYSAEAQMLYDFRKTGSDSPLYHRIFMDSNAIPAQPKSLADVQGQFDELCDYFKIDAAVSGAEKLSILRGKSVEELLEAIPQLKNHTFRPVTDDVFIHSGMIEYLQGKEFADEFKRRGYKLLIGEVRNEETLYSSYNAPTEPTLEALRLQVSNYYAPDVTDRAIQQYKLPESDKLQDWQTTFGSIVSDGQVRAPSRALAKALVDNGVDIRDVWRYQIAYRLSFIDEKVAPASFGVAHAMDRPIWNFSITHGPTPTERQLMEDWIQILVNFVNDTEGYEYGTKSVEEIRVLTPEATIEVRPDERWSELVKLGNIFAGKHSNGSLRAREEWILEAQGVTQLQSQEQTAPVMLHSLRWSAWGPEYWALVGGIISFTAMVVLLACFDGKPIFTWNGVTLNAVVSILSVTMKAAVAFVLSECLAQWKWILFTREDRPLMDFDRIDAATRGPLGSLRIIFRTRGAYAVQLGAILTLLAVALDPLAQQVIQVREGVVYMRSTQTDKGPLALNSGTQTYSMGTAQVTQSSRQNSTTNDYWVSTDTPLSMQGAILNGLSKSRWEVEQEALIQCPTSNCTWDQFKSLGICHKCNDLTSELKQVGGFGQAIIALANTTLAGYKVPGTAFVLPNGHFIANIDGCPPYNGRYAECENKQPLGVYSNDKYTTTSFGTGIPSKTNSMKDVDTLLWSMSIIHPDMEALNKSSGFTPECALYYCVKRIDSAVEGNQVQENVTEALDSRRDPDSWKRSSEYEDGQPENVISKEANGTLEFDKYWSAVYNTDLRLEFPNISNEGYYRISQDSVKSMSAHMQDLFRTNLSGTTDQREEIEKVLGSDAVGFNGASFGPFEAEKWSMKATPPALNGLWTWTRHNITSIFYTLATSMTNEMRRNYAPDQSQKSGQDTDRFQDGSLSYYGNVGKSTVLYHIEWPWIALHGVMLISAIAFLFTTLGNSNSRGNVPLWKSSSLAAIRHGRDVGGVLSCTTTMGEMEDTARKVRVNLQGEESEETKSCIDRTTGSTPSEP